MEINEFGGYEYVLKRLDSGRFFIASQYASLRPQDRWTSKIDSATCAETLSDFYEVCSTAQFYQKVFKESSQELDDKYVEGLEESDAALFQSSLLEGYLVVRTPWVMDNIIDEGDEKYFDEDEDWDYGVIRDKVFGPGAAICQPGERVPDDVSWAPRPSSEVCALNHSLPRAQIEDEIKSDLAFEKAYKEATGKSLLD